MSLSTWRERVCVWGVGGGGVLGVLLSRDVMRHVPVTSRGLARASPFWKQAAGLELPSRYLPFPYSS